MSRFPRLLSAGLAIAALVGLASPSPAQITPPDFYYPGVPINQAGGSGGAGDNTCLQAATFLVRTSGLTATEINAYNGLICAMVADGTFSLLDGLYIFATNNTTTAKLNLVSSSFPLTASSTGTMTFTADVGWLGNGAFLDTTFNPTTAVSPHFTLNSAHEGVYIQTNRTTPQAFADIGVSDGATTYSFIEPYTTGPDVVWEVTGHTFPSVASTTSRGSWILSRSSSTATVLYKNGAQLASSGVDNSVALPNFTITIMALNDGGCCDSFSNDQISAAWFGAGLTGVQAIALQIDINNYMKALGINVF